MSKDDHIIKFLETKTQHSGQSLSNSTGKILADKGYQVNRETPFIDKDENKGRYTDIKAIINIPNVEKRTEQLLYVGRLSLIIECKNLPDHVWLFYNEKTPKDELVIIDKASLDDSVDQSLFPKPPVGKYGPSWPVGELFHASSYDEFILDSNDRKKSKSNSQIRNLYDATMKVTKSTQFELEEIRNAYNKIYPKFINVGRELVIPIFNWIQPVIVFKGNLYGYTENEDPKFARIRYAQIPKRYVSNNYRINNGMIHVVDYNYLEEYLAIIWKFYNRSSTRILEDQPALINTIIPKIISFLRSYEPLDDI